MTDDVRNDFLGMIFRAADFCGIKLVSWCLMANHFHILAYLPEPEEIDEKEILRRYGVLKGNAKLVELQNRLARLQLKGDDGELRAREVLDKIRSGMYDIGVFMKIAKQWLTQEYNRRYSHVGTLWEGVYKDVPVKGSLMDLGKRAGYIHLNPIRAMITHDFAAYRWSSFTALCKGDQTALDGMRLIYGEEAAKDEIEEAHRHLMSSLLEGIKFEKALDIARKRNAGFDCPCDPLTDEALLAQASSHLEKVMQESINEKSLARTAGRPRGGNKEIECQIVNLLRMNPKMSKAAIAEAMGIGRTTVYEYLKRIEKCSEYSGFKV